MGGVVVNAQVPRHRFQSGPYEKARVLGVATTHAPDSTDGSRPARAPPRVKLLWLYTGTFPNSS